MNLEQVKLKLGVTVLEMREQFNAQGTATGWYRCWDNKNRVNYVSPTDVIKKIHESDKLFDTFDIIKKRKDGSLLDKPYTRVMILEGEEAQGDVIVL